jgi:hypothetical protein
MNILRCIVLLQLATTWALCQAAHQQGASTVHDRPETMVRSFYSQVVARKPIGIPYGENMKAFAPYLSQSLSRKIELATACGKDWHRQHPNPTMKPEMAWLEAGLFSGDDERASPGSFQIDGAHAEKDGSFRVDVSLRYRPQDGPGFWKVTAIVIREDDHFVIDDVVYWKDENSSPLAPAEWRLSLRLSQGCDGPRWVGRVGNPARK